MCAPSLGYVPYLRPGALLFTAIVWRYLLKGGTNEVKAVEEIYGHIGGRKRNLYGERVRFATSALFGDSLSARDVLQRHTLFGIYSRALSQNAADSWANSLIDGGRRSNKRPPIRAPIEEGFRSFTAELRSCKRCVMMDLDEFGFPSWHLLHVLPPVHHCPYHGDALITEIKGNIGGNMWQLRLPTGVSIEEPRHTFTSASDGYVAYLRLWTELLDGKLPIISAETWANYMSHVAERTGSTENAIGELSEHLTRSWDSRPDQLRNLLGNHVQHDFVRNELEHRTTPSRIAQKLVILTACDSLGILPPRETTPEQTSLALSFNSRAAPLQPREQLLRDALLHFGVPLAMLPGLISGHCRQSISRSSGVHRHQVQRAIDNFPSALLDELFALGSWPADSWLTKVILRRNRRKTH